MSWIPCSERLPNESIDNVLFTVYSPAWHDNTEDFAEDERDFPATLEVFAGHVYVVNGERTWGWVDNDGWLCVINNEYSEEYFGQKKYITAWMPFPEAYQEK